MAENNTTKSNGQISVQDAQVAMVMVPLPAQGHLNQLLHLSRLMTSYNIPVKLRVHGFDPVTTKNLHFHEFPTPPFEKPPPNPNASHKFPNHILPLFYAAIHFREPLCSLVNQLLGANHRRVIVICDCLMTWVLEDISAIPNAECYRFNGFSAFYMFSSYWETKGKPFQPETEIFEDIISSENCATPELRELWNKQGALEGKICSGELYNTSRVIEGSYLDLVAKETNGLNLWAIGPFNPLLSEQNKLNCFDVIIVNFVQLFSYSCCCVFSPLENICTVQSFGVSPIPKGMTMTNSNKRYQWRKYCDKFTGRLTFHCFLIGVGGSIKIALLEDSDSTNVAFISTSFASNDLAFLMLLSLLLGRDSFLCSTELLDLTE
ncbi:hypothetical protein H5410_028555 [Solanum commersonii]|uniref:Glycosyltransferase N-terminal domain-containing protein n=1 Tax=Solanum commersonii TaxID=4109 RepID=A0A9J5Z590_SOLCO|nr:hypothetical protein H5410_028555 [Solanum commersonii]